MIGQEHFHNGLAHGFGVGAILEHHMAFTLVLLAGGQLGAHAGALLKAVAAEMGGKGGGSPTLAQGGAQSSKDLGKAFDAAPKLFEELMAKGK